jgi:hypothetical protein
MGVLKAVFQLGLMYSETSLQRTRTGPKKLSAIEGCPLKREVITLVHYVTDLKNRP